MEWEDIIKSRKTIFTYSNKEVSKEVVEKMLQDMHTYMPSKQNKMPFEISVLDWSNPELRNWIFENCHRNEEDSVEDDLGNPQVLAPWLFAFSIRNLSDEEIENNIECRSDRYMSIQGNIEIGIASSFIVYHAQNNGLSTGYCRCFRDPVQMGERLGHQNRITLLLGLGYSEDRNYFLDPRTNTFKDLPDDHVFHKQRQPAQSEYIKWHL